jgi:hypothetical protein
LKHLDIKKILEDLSLKRPLFHSEADFQHELAWEIHLQYPGAKLRLEKPSGNPEKKERIDIEVILNNQITMIELKYKKTKLEYNHIDEHFRLSNDGAQDITRYDFIKDILRLEEYIDRNPEAVGYAIILTNDDLYHRDSNGKCSAAFFINEGRELKKGIEMNWHENTSIGTKKSREKGHVLSNDYNIKWEKYSEINIAKKNIYKSLIIHIPSKKQ